AENIWQGGRIRQSHFRIKASEKARVPVSREPNAPLNGSNSAGQVLRGVLAVVALSPDLSREQATDPLLPVLSVELTSKGHLLHRELHDAHEILRNQIGPRQPDTALKPSVADLPCCQVIKRMHERGSLLR